MTLARHLRLLRTFYVLAFAVVLLTVLVNSASAEISVGQAFGAWKEYIDAIFSAAIFLIVGLVLGAIYKFTGIKVEDSARAALQTALTNAAGRLVTSVGTKLEDIHSLTTGNPAVDQAVNMVLNGVPAAVARFGLTPERIAEMIKAKAPQVINTVAPPV